VPFSNKKMNLLMLQDLYPPAVGGFGQACCTMAGALASRGHRVDVLTTRGIPARPDDQPAVLPLLEPYRHRPVRSRLLGYHRRHRTNRRSLMNLLQQRQYDLVVVWKLWEVPDSLLLSLQQSEARLAYYLHDGWMIPGRRGRWDTFWGHQPDRSDLRLAKAALTAARAKPLLERLLYRWLEGGPQLPRGTQAAFVSRSCADEYRQAGVALENPVIIPNGIDLGRFHPNAMPRVPGPFRLLFAGRIGREKGVHVLIEALAQLDRASPAWTLDIVGPIEEEAYATELRDRARASGISEQVHFAGALPHDELPACYRDHDVLVFPSVGIERFPLVIVEAMACGLPVVTTFTGGQDELLTDGQDCLAARAADPKHLATLLSRLLGDDSFRRNLGAAGLETVRRKLSLDESCDQMESFLTAQLQLRNPG
jgi:glycosyltransferase involved in cell wall biosynthesis